MTLLVPDDLAATARQRDRMLRDAETEMADASAAAMRDLLTRMRDAALGPLTAANPPLPRATSDLFTLGQIHGWWEDAIDEHVVGTVGRLWQAGRASSTDLAASTRSLDAAGTYVANVRDRLSRTAQPTIPEEAFNTVRVALADELARGSTSAEISRRLGAELQWTGQDVGFWTERRGQITQQIDAILDPLGPPGTPAREAARLADPRVRELQSARSDIVQRLDRDASQWQTRATRIARTETTGAYNSGAQQAFIEEGAGAKMWIATGDDATRESHLDAAGQCVPTDASFDVGVAQLMMPGDPSGPADEVINCRCTMVAGRSCEELGGLAEAASRTIDEERDRRDLPPAPDQEVLGITE